MGMPHRQMQWTHQPHGDSTDGNRYISYTSGETSRGFNADVFRGRRLQPFFAPGATNGQLRLRAQVAHTYTLFFFCLVFISIPWTFLIHWIGRRSGVAGRRLGRARCVRWLCIACWVWPSLRSSVLHRILFTLTHTHVA